MNALQPAYTQAAELIQAVLEERLSAREALYQWPRQRAEDASLQAAFQALWYFEADEERHQSEPFYLDIQLSLLNTMAEQLRAGRPLNWHLRKPYQNRVRWYQPWWERLKATALWLQNSWCYYRNLVQ